jgi:nitroreductase
MELRDAIRTRRMTRSYDPDRPVPVELLDELLALAVRAPSAGHTQGWQFLVLASADARGRFWTATAEGEPDGWLRRMQTAPVVVLCLADKRAYLERWPVPYWSIDTGMAALLLLLAAHDAGLGACFFGVPAARVDAVFAEFHVEPELIPVGVVSLGWPAPDLRSPSLKRGRRPLADVVRYV